MRLVKLAFATPGSTSAASFSTEGPSSSFTQMNDASLRHIA